MLIYHTTTIQNNELINLLLQYHKNNFGATQNLFLTTTSIEDLFNNIGIQYGLLSVKGKVKRSFGVFIEDQHKNINLIISVNLQNFLDLKINSTFIIIPFFFLILGWRASDLLNLNYFGSRRYINNKFIHTIADNLNLWSKDYKNVIEDIFIGTYYNFDFGSIAGGLIRFEKNIGLKCNFDIIFNDSNPISKYIALYNSIFYVIKQPFINSVFFRSSLVICNFLLFTLARRLIKKKEVKTHITRFDILLDINKVIDFILITTKRQDLLNIINTILVCVALQLYCRINQKNIKCYIVLVLLFFDFAIHIFIKVYDKGKCIEFTVSITFFTRFRPRNLFITSW